MSFVLPKASPAARQELDDLLAGLDNYAGNIDAMRAERACGIQTFKQFREGSLSPNEITGDERRFTLLSGTWLGQAYLNNDEAKYIELLNAQIDLLQHPRGERVDAVDGLWESIEESRWRYMFTCLLSPALNAATNAANRADAHARCLRILLAVQGREEMSLDDVDLPHAAKTDPYSGGPLLLMWKDEGVTVYSVGENEVDDGGDVFG